MSIRILAFGACAMLASNVANAAVLFDTINPPAGPTIGYDGPVSDSVSVLAESFYAPSAAALSKISLTLSATNPNDGGSVLVYLVADNGAGAASGVAGMPTYTGGSTFTGYTNASLLGTVSDSSLANTTVGSSTVSFNVLPTLVTAAAATTANNEYWVALVASGNSSFNWYYNANGSGIGTTGQSYFNNVGGTLSTSADSTGAYQLQVTTPEPTTLAVLGASLAGFGYLRRKRNPKV